MPYYQREWNVLLGEQAPKQTRNVRTIAAIDIVQQAAADQPDPKPINVDLNTVINLQNALKKAVEEFKTKMKGAAVIKKPDNYQNYVVNKEQVVFKGLHSEIYRCISAEYKQIAMMAREFKPSAGITVDDHYLKVLRHIGKAHPAIIQTMDIFVDNKRHVFMFQEFANRGNGMEFTKQGNQASEQQIQSWTQAIYQALDYLSEKAISHRSIHPKHILLMDGPNGVLDAKLGGFRDAIVYWDPAVNDIIDQPCQAMIDLKHFFFHAPESFGQEGEYFNPIPADLWSLGATMFYFVSRQYPFDAADPEQNLDGEIRNTLAACTTLSDDGKYFLYGLLRTNTKLRTEFDAIRMDPWLQPFQELSS